MDEFFFIVLVVPKLKTDFWKSNDRKYCDFCNCWIADNKASISFHENGKRHKLAVAKRISDISRNSAKAEKEKMKMDHDIRKMEDAALKSYARDVSSYADMTAKSINAISQAMCASASTTSTATASNTAMPNRQIDPLRLPGNSDDEDDSNRPTVKKVADIEPTVENSLWIEAKTDAGYTYYWNVKTNQSVWETPKEGYMTMVEYEKINQIALAQQELNLAKDSHKFRENAEEEVARYNREKFKQLRKPEQEKLEKEKQKKKEKFKTEADIISPAIGQWQVVETKVKEEHLDLELPKVNKWIPQVVSTNTFYEPTVKKFKEKTIVKLESDNPGESSTFKKRKIQKGNARQRSNDD